MGSVDEISQLCRLCLVKDQVNIPIFDESSDIGQIFMKINSCLPVKVSRDDNLPKKICDGCSYKLDMLYIFHNTTIDSEKQLISWLNQAGLSTISQTAVKDPLANTKPEVMVKQETFDSTDARIEGDPTGMGMDAQNYIIQQQQLPYQQDFDFGEASGSTAELTEEPAPKRAKRAAALKKVPIDETEETEDDLDAAMQITKAEEEDSEDVDQPEYVEAPSTSADDQPGPSGVGKAAVEAPLSIDKQQVVSFIFVPVDGGLSDKKLEPTVRKPIRYIVFRKEKQNKIENNIHFYKQENKNFCSKNLPLFNVSKIPTKYKPETESREKSLYSCSECNKQFKSRSSVISHKEIVHQGSTFLCEICGRILKHGSNLLSHMRTQHGDPDNPIRVTCKICNKEFKSTGGLRGHVRVAHEGRRHLCETCGKYLSSLESWHSHVRIHTGEKPFACKYCKKSFTRKVDVKIHERVHTKEKPHKCELCVNRYSQRSSLTLHIRTAHNGEKPHICTVCGKKFVTKSLLNTHLKIHVKKSV